MPAREQGQRVEACCAERRKMNIEFKSLVEGRGLGKENNHDDRRIIILSFYLQIV